MIKPKRQKKTNNKQYHTAVLHCVANIIEIPKSCHASSTDKQTDRQTNKQKEK